MFNFVVKIKKKTDEMKKNTNKNQILHSRSLMGVNSEIEKNQTTRMFDAERIIMPNIEWRVNVFFLLLSISNIDDLHWPRF